MVVGMIQIIEIRSASNVEKDSDIRFLLSLSYTEIVGGIGYDQIIEVAKIGHTGEIVSCVVIRSD